MRGRTLVLALVAVLLAGGTALLVRSRLERPPVTITMAPARTAVAQKSVLVARVALGRGQILKSADIGWQAWPDGALSASYVVAGAAPASAFAGWVAREPFVAGEPIIKAKLVAPGDRGFLAAVLHPGMRAVSVPVSTTSGIAGFIFPGDHVDVLTTYTLPAADASSRELERKVAETVLHNVRVLAIDQELENKGGAAAMPAHTVTLELTPKESEVIALASNVGQLSLSLRSLVASRDGTASDPPSEASARSFTLDSDVSRLIADDQVTIIRGGGRSTTAVDDESVAKGR
jgi:pilus assembly protein CpaB